MRDSENDNLNYNEGENDDLEDIMKWYRINMINEEEKEDTQCKQVNSSNLTSTTANNFSSDEMQSNASLSSTGIESPITS